MLKKIKKISKKIERFWLFCFGSPDQDNSGDVLFGVLLLVPYMGMLYWYRLYDHFPLVYSGIVIFLFALKRFGVFQLITPKKFKAFKRMNKIKSIRQYTEQKEQQRLEEKRQLSFLLKKSLREIKKEQGIISELV